MERMQSSSGTCRQRLVCCKLVSCSPGIVFTGACDRMNKAALIGVLPCNNVHSCGMVPVMYSTIHISHRTQQTIQQTPCTCASRMQVHDVSRALLTCVQSKNPVVCVAYLEPAMEGAQRALNPEECGSTRCPELLTNTVRQNSKI